MVTLNLKTSKWYICFNQKERANSDLNASFLGHSPPNIQAHLKEGVSREQALGKEEGSLPPGQPPRAKHHQAASSFQAWRPC